MKTKGERREEKRQRAGRHKTSGRSVFVLQHAIGKRAEEIRAKRIRD